MDREKAEKAVQKQVKRKVRRKAKQGAKKIHPLSYVVWVLALAAGVGCGILGYRFLCRNDGFTLNGKKVLTVPVSQEDELVQYKDQGATVISFGRDRSDFVRVETNLTETDEDGVYTVDTSKEGEYYISYTIDDPKFGNIRRVRVIRVVGGDN